MTKKTFLLTAILLAVGCANSFAQYFFKNDAGKDVFCDPVYISEVKQEVTHQNVYQILDSLMTHIPMKQQGHTLKPREKPDFLSAVTKSIAKTYENKLGFYEVTATENPWTGAPEYVFYVFVFDLDGNRYEIHKTYLLEQW